MERLNVMSPYWGKRVNRAMRALTLEECINTYGGCCVCDADTGFSNVFATPLTIRDSLFKQ